MIVVLLIVHGHLAVALLGATTHQALSVLPERSVAQPMDVSQSGWAWIIPTAVVVEMLIYERRWFV